MEKFFKIYRTIGCWISLAFMIITDELSINDKIKDFIWLMLLILNIIIVIIAFKREKNTKTGEKIFAIIGLTLVIGYTIYFVLEKFI